MYRRKRGRALLSLSLPKWMTDTRRRSTPFFFAGEITPCSGIAIASGLSIRVALAAAADIILCPHVGPPCVLSWVSYAGVDSRSLQAACHMLVQQGLSFFHHNAPGFFLFRPLSSPLHECN